ncbi:MAG TPA: TetR/AcrR family transcriptional regulator [Symbiobacteriaceae bacterium]
MGRTARREQVLQAAAALFSRKGYHATTVRDIGEESGMLSGSLYAHIHHKEDLLYELVLRAAERFQAAVRPVVEGEGSASEKLTQAMAAHLKVVAESLAHARIFLHEWRALTGKRWEAAAALRREYEDLLARVIRQGVESGEFRPVDEKCARLLVLGALNWTYEWYDPEGPLGPEEIAKRFADIVVEGLRNREGGGTT